MAKFNYPIASGLPSYIQFRPEGGLGGSPAFRIQAQGSTPSILWIRQGMMQVEDCNVTVDLIVNNSQLTAANNQYEGITIIAMLLSSGTSIPTIKWSNQVLGNPYDQWHHARDGWRRISRVLELPDDHGGEELMIGVVVKASSGGYSDISGLSVVNSYERTYRAEVFGASNSITMTRKDQVKTFRSSLGGTRIVTVSWQDSYLDTIPVRVRKNEVVNVNGEGIVNATVVNASGDTLTGPMVMSLTLKFTGTAGEEYFHEIFSINGVLGVVPETIKAGSSTFTAEFEIVQMEPIIAVDPYVNYTVYTVNAGHRGIKLQMTTSRNLLSS